MRKILILGATSAIAEHTARLFAVDHDQFFLVARNSEKLVAISQDLKTRGALSVGTYTADLSDTRTHASVWNQASQQLGDIDTVLIAYGILPNQKACETDYNKAAESFQVNLLSVISLLTLVANDFERKRAGCIAVITSVAGDRGRQSNYIYGSAKGALSVFLQGLRNRLSKYGVTVLTIKPGLVSTPMTAHLKPSMLFASPAHVAKGIYRAIKNRKDVAYVPGYWRGVMAVIKSVPEKVFKRTNL